MLYLRRLLCVMRSGHSEECDSRYAGYRGSLHVRQLEDELVTALRLQVKAAAGMRTGCRLQARTCISLLTTQRPVACQWFLRYQHLLQDLYDGYDFIARGAAFAVLTR